MEHGSLNNSETKNVICPYCHSTLSVPVNCFSTNCKFCSRQISAGEFIETGSGKKKFNIEKRKIICFKCGEMLLVDKNAQSVICKHCYYRNEVGELKIKTVFGTVIQTHGQLYLLKKGAIETSTVEVGSAIIRGRIVGNIKVYGTVEILKNGEVRGNITCQRLIVRKGGIFQGEVVLINAETSPHIAIKSEQGIGQ